jgi:CMP/dCMP kinase
MLDATTVALDGDHVLVNGRDVTGEIRAPAIGELTSVLTMLRPVRDKMTPMQRTLAADGGVVLEGRDTGSVVCPDADVKFYLDATLDARARRRREELMERGVTVDLDHVREEVARRDRQDMGRAIAPLVRPADAVVVDTTGLDEARVLERLMDAVERARCSTRS